MCAVLYSLKLHALVVNDHGQEVGPIKPENICAVLYDKAAEYVPS
jgi:hypothetical protein